MKKMLSLWLLLLPLWMHAQPQPNLRITINATDEPIASILDRVESQYPVFFFYQPDKLPQEPRSVNLTDGSLDDLMDALLQATTFGYMRYDERSVVLMPRSIVNQVYSADYYKALEKSLAQANEPEAEEQAQDRQMVIGSINDLDPSGRAEVTGTITDRETGEPIIGATVFHPASGAGSATDVEGLYQINLPTGEQELQVQFVGYQSIARSIIVYSDGSLDLQMAETAVDLGEVVIEAEAADANISGAVAGIEQLDVEAIKKLPSFLGEADVVKSLLLLPGVSTVGEGATGFNVRGGEVDQNLIQQDDGFIFNSSHALGFFSTFNTDLIQSVELYKGSIPAQFGGRLSSVMDVEMRDGDFDKFGMKGSVSPISAKISVETPVVKGTSSLIGGLRSSYLNYLLPLADVPEVERSSAFFYDANLRYTHRIGEKHIVTLSGYSAFDDFVYNEEFGFEYETIMGQIIYRTLFSDKMFNRLSFTYSQYDSGQEELQGVQAARIETGVNYWKVRDLFSYVPDQDFRMDVGFDLVRYDVNPGRQFPLDEAGSEIVARELQRQQGLEGAAFFNLEYSLSSWFLLSAGLRYNNFRFLGPQTLTTYEHPNRPEENEITGEESYAAGESITTYAYLEPRASLRLRFSPSSSIKAGYGRTSQFINQIFNTAAPTPVNQWQLSSRYVRPFLAHNYTLGYFKNLRKNLWETSLEVYYRDIFQLFDYEDFAELNVNDRLETEILNGTGRSYGLEVSIKKKEGLVNGWLSYTYSRAERQVEGINFGEYYPSNFDIPHNTSLVLNLQPNQRHTLTLNFNYSRGRPTTYPLGNYESPSGLVVPLYSQRNQLRIPDYHRLDVAYTLGQGYNKTKRVKTSWTFSIYNVYGRENPFSVFFTEGAFQQVQANRLAILGSAFPSITINFEFL